VTEIADYVRFCREIRELSAAQVLERMPDFSLYCEGCVPEKLIATYQRHADEVLSTFHRRAGQFDTLFFGR
jgi:hypothetical protein